MRGIDPSDPASMQGLIEGGMFELPKSPLQQAALQRLEIVLALVEGWVDEVVGQATATRMPAAGKLQEAVRRRRAAGGPAEETPTCCPPPPTSTTRWASAPTPPRRTR